MEQGREKIENLLLIPKDQELKILREMEGEHGQGGDFTISMEHESIDNENVEVCIMCLSPHPQVYLNFLN